MTIEEKLKYLQDASMEDARAMGNEIISEHQEALDQILKEHKETAIRQAELTLKTETANARQSLNKAMARAQIELKREQGKCQTDLKNRLFKRVLVLVKEYMKTDDYKKILEKRIQKSLDFADGEEILIYINPSDAHLKDDLEAKTGSSLTVSREDFIGGTRAVMQKRRILIDYSFKSALSEEYGNFLFLGGDNYV